MKCKVPVQSSAYFVAVFQFTSAWLTLVIRLALGAKQVLLNFFSLSLPTFFQSIFKYLHSKAIY